MAMRKTTAKIIVDIAMTLALLFLMGYQFWGEIAHEWIGTGMFVLFIVHHILNLNWHKHIFKGNYTFMRTLQTVIDVLILISMAALMYSGIVMSRHVFVFLPIDSGMALARRLHILGSYWGFVLMSAHLGLHWNMMIGIARKKAKVKESSKIRTAVLFMIGLLVAIYGFYNFIQRDFITYMFLKSEFVFLDYSESVALFYLDYLALMGFFVFLFHYLGKGVRALKSQKKSKSHPKTRRGEIEMIGKIRNKNSED